MNYDSSMIHLGDLRSIYFCLGQEVNNLESSVVVLELEFAINLVCEA